MGVDSHHLASGNATPRNATQHRYEFSPAALLEEEPPRLALLKGYLPSFLNAIVGCFVCEPEFDVVVPEVGDVLGSGVLNVPCRVACAAIRPWG